MIRIFKNCFLIFSFTFFPSLSFADWELVKESHNVKLYRPTAEADQFISKIEAEVNTPLQSLIDVIEDPDACNKWLFRCQRAQHISKTDSDHLYTYYVRDYPFPLKDRHGVLEITKGLLDNGEFFMTLELQHNMTPEETSLVVPDTFKAKIRLIKVADNKTKIYLEHHLNPGGKVPNWLKKSIHEEFPFNSMVGLIESAQGKRLSEVH